jgi:hypothetical protein
VTNNRVAELTRAAQTQRNPTDGSVKPALELLKNVLKSELRLGALPDNSRTVGYELRGSLSG